jgi:hypothetical protein
MGMTAVASIYGTCTFIGHNYLYIHNILYRLSFPLNSVQNIGPVKEKSVLKNKQAHVMMRL